MPISINLKNPRLPETKTSSFRFESQRIDTIRIVSFGSTEFRTQSRVARGDPFGLDLTS